MKKILLFLLLSPLFCGHIQAQDMATIRFVNKDSLYDFGSIKTGEQPRYEFEIKNAGDAALTITEIKSENSNLKFEWPEKPVKPHKKAIISVTYNPKVLITTGSFSSDVLVTSNATQRPYPFIHVSGTVVPSHNAKVTPPSDDHLVKTGSELFYGDPPVK
jgi:hypothetical protein